MHDTSVIGPFLRGFCFLVALAATQQAAAREGDGIRHVPAFDLPLSPYMSPEAQAAARVEIAEGDPLAHMSNEELARNIQQIRASVDASIAPRVEALRQRYGVSLRQEQWGGVPVTLVTPKAPVARGLLIELHGGGFIFGSAGTMGMLEAIPVAAMTGMRVVAVDYRLGPEHRYPAASEDVAAVYREALKRHRPGELGLFGCSSGGVLTAEALAWFQKEKLPLPAAAGVFCAGADARYGGDARYVVAAVNNAPMPKPDGSLPIMEELYYGQADLADPLISPLFSKGVLAKFPPTLFITGTRAAELSAAAHTHSRLTALGVEARLHVWDGMGHAFHLNTDLPEAQEALAVIARFFKAYVGRPGR
ncbi:alpha/beta hydrolase [Archangium lipolyticum]|uniref:alpha/beta hydrolase n=1 Tax=Archangium lipolyticum TaxID=2970465 RepID=UPI00214B4D3B|nr:alpha/beta hydrolase [Archangium lipolyticum]